MFGATCDGPLQRGWVFEVSSPIEQGSLVLSSGSEDLIVHVVASDPRRAAHRALH